jgi:hypothetical protein
MEFKKALMTDFFLNWKNIMKLTIHDVSNDNIYINIIIYIIVMNVCTLLFLLLLL